MNYFWPNKNFDLEKCVIKLNFMHNWRFYDSSWWWNYIKGSQRLYALWWNQLGWTRNDLQCMDGKGTQLCQIFPTFLVDTSFPLMYKNQKTWIIISNITETSYAFETNSKISHIHLPKILISHTTRGKTSIWGSSPMSLFDHALLFLRIISQLTHPV